MGRLSRWWRAHGLRALAFATLAASAGLAAFVWDVSAKFQIKEQALARAGSESAGYVGIAATVLGSWVLPALVGVTALALVTFVTALRRPQPAGV